ncbi:MAG TPA: hypothetical protein VNL72_01040 [Gammaproteobacteria bacterium]|nr:hypothetical protein [Gammaproteobacteria bacterium]
MSLLHLRLHVPGLLEMPRAALRDAPAVPALERLLAHASRRVLPFAGERGDLAVLFGLSSESARVLSMAACLCAARGFDTGDGWLCADAVHLRAEAGTLRLFGPGVLAVSEAERDALAAGFEAAFAAEGYRLHPVGLARWLLRVPHRFDVRLADTAAVHGRDVLAFMPQGPDGAHIAAFLNEVQMLWHEHPVNTAREAQGLPAINGLWLWGEGEEQGMPHRTDCVTAWTDDPLCAGAARRLGAEVRPGVRTCAEWLARAMPGVHVVSAGDLCPAALRGDATSWQTEVERLERDWFAPAAAALAAGKLKVLELCLGGEVAYRVTRPRLWQFWRRPRSLAERLS